MRLFIASIALCGFACGHPTEDHSETMSSLQQQDLSGRFPTIPEDEMTPGSLCKHPDELRYPERIPYCNRSVSKSLKNQIIHAYDVSFNYTIEQMNRQDFKIDHLIPLCMGGSNEQLNLWPQHMTVYTLTDQLEERLCTGMAQGALTQVEALEMIRDAKHHHEMIPEIKSKIAAIVH